MADTALLIGALILMIWVAAQIERCRPNDFNDHDPEDWP